LTTALGFVSGLAWTADGKELVFGRAQYPSPSPPYLWRVPVSGEREPQRIDLAGVGGFPAVTASSLAFVRRGLQEDLLRLAEGQVPETLLASTANEQDASYSPNGTKIAFATDRSGEGTEIWVADTADGSRGRSVTNGTHRPEGSPRWSPNGLRLAYDGIGDDGARHIYLIDEAGGRIQAISGKPGFNDQIPSWSGDARWIYFGSNRTGRYEVWRAPAAGGDAQQVTTTGGSSPFEPRDGKALYYLRAEAGVRRLFSMPVAGGREQPLDITTSFWNYLPVEKGIYYVAPRQGQKPPHTFEVRFLEFTTGKTRVVHSVRLGTIGPGLSVMPDGKIVLIAGVAEITQDLMRIDNFR
jgi:Tol biopolymer transport system component